ncbi:MAG: LamG domain-containing protein, partial [Planctomycetes bacterium]|nr:LamG domain-containing protein [Planctomycetota bacterium]
MLFRASFDQGIDRADTATGDPAFVPGLYDRSPLWKDEGLADWQRSKDYKAFRAAQAKEGRLGACLDVPLGKGHRFRALGNVSVRRGTFAFWLKFGRPLSTAHASIFEAGGAGHLRIRYKTVLGRVASSEFSLKDVPWQPNQWYHVALVYDC